MTNTDPSAFVKQLFSNRYADGTVLNEMVKKYEAKAKRITSRLSNPSAKVQLDNAISSIPPEGIVINQPGTYYFTNNINWSPGTALTGIAINISCDNVVLDLKTFQLTAVNAIPDANLVGINIVGCENTIVQNGELINMPFHGISAELNLNLYILNIIVQGSAYSYFGTEATTTPSGIYVEASENVEVVGCTVTGINVTAPAYAGIQLFAIPTNALVSNCSASKLVNNDGTVTGFSYELCSQVTTTYCQSSEFRSHYQGKTTTFGHTVLGFLPTGCANLRYENCTASNLRGCCDDCHGMSIFESNDITVVNFRASGIVDGDAPTNTGAKATGLEVYGNDIHIKFCVVENIFAIVPQDKQSCGFSAAGKNITFESCVANNVIVCDEHRNPTNDYAKYGYGIGFGWAPDPREEFVNMYAENTIYSNCSALYCQVGFDTWNHINGIWRNWKAENCNINVLQELGNTRIFAMDKCSELPNGATSPMTIYNHSSNNNFTPPV